ncbi:hypothetical protein QJQ45_014157 [Haematococcus lacustris]|nr:hypothetical protein QJQ45_014157 [Haematococcus lacustris]
MCVTSTKILSICSCLALLLFMARKKRRTGVGGPRAVPEDPDFDIVDRDEAGQPDLTEAQRKRKASGEARAARSRDITFHARKAKLAHLTDHLPQALWDAFLDKAVRPRVKAISERGVIGSLLLGFLVRGLFTLHVADQLDAQGQPLSYTDTDIPVSAADIPNLSCRNLFLQLAVMQSSTITATSGRRSGGSVVSSGPSNNTTPAIFTLLGRSLHKPAVTTAATTMLPMPPRRSGRVTGQDGQRQMAPATEAPATDAAADAAAPTVVLVPAPTGLPAPAPATAPAPDDDDDDVDDAVLAQLYDDPSTAALQQRGGMSEATKLATESALAPHARNVKSKGKFNARSISLRITNLQRAIIFEHSRLNRFTNIPEAERPNLLAKTGVWKELRDLVDGHDKAAYAAGEICQWIAILHEDCTQSLKGRITVNLERFDPEQTAMRTQTDQSAASQQNNPQQLQQQFAQLRTTFLTAPNRPVAEAVSNNAAASELGLGAGFSFGSGIPAAMSPVSVALPTAHVPASQQLVSQLALAVPNVGALGVAQSQQNVGPNSAGQPANEANVGELAERIAAAAAAAVAAAPGQDRLTTMAAFTNAAAHLVTLARSFPDPVSTSRIASAVLPSHGPQSNVKVTLPAIKKWGLKCLFDGRDLDLFLTDCQQFARASNQAPAATIILMVSDELRRVLNLQVSQALSLGKQLTEQEVVASLKELIGYNMHDAKHIAMTRLVHGSIKQRTDQTVLEYAVDFRLEVMRADALPAAVLCDLFVKGLKATIAAQCARTSAGLLWTDLNECITYAIGKEATMHGGSRSGAPVAILSHQDQRKGVDRGHSSFPARGRGRGVLGLMTSDEGHQFKRDGGQWQPVPQGLVPHGGGGRGGPLRGRRGDDQWDRGYDQSSHGKAGVAIAEEAHEEARAVAARQAQEVVAAMEAPGVVAVKGDGKEARVANRVAAKAVGKEATVAKEAVGRVALSSQHLLLRQCFTSLMSQLPQVHATVSIERNVTPVAAKILPEMLEGIDLILGADWQKSHGVVLDVGSNICHIKVGNKLHKLHSQHHKFRPGAAVLAAVADSGEAVKVLSAKQAARALRKGCCSVLALVQPSAANDDEGWYNGSLASVLVNNQEGCERPGLVPASVIDSMVHEEFPTVFQDMPAGLPPDRGVGHTIRLEPGHAPPYQRARRYSLKEMDEMRKQVAELLAKKLIEPSSSPYGAPVLFVQKRDGTLRMCIDFRALNKLTVRDRYPLPRIDDLFDRVQGKTVFSSLDLQSGYHQIRITPEDVPKTAFVTPGGQFQYKVLCFGLTNAPATFQRVMNRIFEKQLLAGTVLVYLDDILVMSRSPAEHVQHLREVLQVMKDNNLYAKLSKCEFNKPELKFLGHIVGRHGIAVDPAKVQVIQDWAMPTCLKELQAFLGLANFFRRFIAGYSTIAAPLTHLTGEAVAAGTNWRQLSEPAVNAFNALKQALCSAPLLALPDPLQPFEVWSDASLAGTGGVLMQNGRVVAYTSHKFTPAQVKYTTGEQELLGIIRAMQEWRCYLDGAVHVTIVTDHNPLIYLKTQTNLSRRQARWMEFLARFDHHIEYKPGKGNVDDPLSRNPGLTHHDDDDDGQPILLTMGAQLCVSGVYAVVMTRRQAGLQVQPPFQPPPVPPSQPAAPRKQKRQQKRVRCASGGPPPPAVVPCDKWPDGGEKQLDSATHTPTGKTHSTTQGSSLVKAIINGYSTDDRFADRAYTQAYELSETGLWMSGGKVVVPKSPLVKREVLEACHDAKYAGHMGMSKTWHTVDLSFTWPGMRKDVEDYVRQCDACQRNKPSTRLKAKAPAPVYTWSSLGKYRGPHFNSHFWEHVCALCKVAHYMSSAYHPESDGQTERVNRVIEEMLRHYVNDAHTDWAEHLPWVEFAINNSWHESIRQTPFFLNYGQHPLTPATLDLPRKVPKASAFAENVEKEVHKARQCWREAQQRMKALVDGKRREVTYKPEQLVMLSTVNMRKRKDEVGVRKLKPRYVGPFVVLRMIGLVAVQIQLPHRWTRMHNVFHVSLVKPYLGTQAPNMAAPPPVQWLDGEPVYEVEKLLQHKVVKVRGRGNGKGRKPGKNVKQALEFLVRWVGYSEEHDTWEPQKNLVNCDEALQQYIDEHGPLPVP